MKHKHHIIPRHIGGINGPIIELTIAEHAEIHRKLYEQYGRWQDKLAWQGLSGQIGMEEIISQRCSQGGKKGGVITRDKGYLKAANKAAVATGKTGFIKMAKEGTLSDFASKLNKKRLKNKTHNFLGEQHPSKIRSKNGTHFFFGKSNPVHKQLKEGTAFSQKQQICPRCGKVGKGGGMVQHIRDRKGCTNVLYSS